MSEIIKNKLNFVSTLVGLFAAAAIVLVPASALADSSGAIYSYNLQNATATAVNTAVNGPQTNLVLTGDYTNQADGTLFAGNTTEGISAGFAEPAGVFSIDVGSDKAFGVGAVFTADLTSVNCQLDSQNITQIGRFATGQAQIKLQLSKCDDASGMVQPECRLAGVDSPAGSPVLKGRRVIEDGHTYNFTCVKNIQSNGSAVVRMITKDLDTGATDTIYHTISATGIIVSDKNLSVANQHPLPTQAGNSDQFVGVVAAIGYCEGVHVGAVTSCLETSLEVEDIEPPVEPPVDTEVASGQLDSTKIEAPKWVATSWIASQTGTVDATFNWADQSADIRFKIVDVATGNVIMWPGSDRTAGITRSFEAVEGAEYRLESWSKAGTSTFDVQFTL